MESIYFEKQQDALCAQHALNMLLQQDYVGPSELSVIARRLDSNENQVLDDDSKNIKSQNMNDSGYFSVQVISEALKTLGLELIHIDHPSVASIKFDPLSAKAFICNQSEHWFTLRKFGQQWFLLNSVKDGPELISDTYLSMYLHELSAHGYSIFVVRGVLPHSVADDVITLYPVQLTKGGGKKQGDGRKLGTANNFDDADLKTEIDLGLTSNTDDSLLTLMKNRNSNEDSGRCDSDDIRKKREGFLKKFQ